MKYNCNTCLLTLEYVRTKIANKMVGQIQVQEVVSQHVVNIAHSHFLQNSNHDKAALQAAYMLEQVNNINKEANILETSVENTYKCSSVWHGINF